MCLMVDRIKRQSKKTESKKEWETFLFEKAVEQEDKNERIKKRKKKDTTVPTDPDQLEQP